MGQKFFFFGKRLESPIPPKAIHLAGDQENNSPWLRNDYPCLVPTGEAASSVEVDALLRALGVSRLNCRILYRSAL